MRPHSSIHSPAHSPPRTTPRQIPHSSPQPQSPPRSSPQPPPPTSSSHICQYDHQHTYENRYKAYTSTSSLLQKSIQNPPKDAHYASYDLSKYASCPYHRGLYSEDNYASRRPEEPQNLGHTFSHTDLKSVLSSGGGHRSMAELHQASGTRSLRYRGSISPTKALHSPLKRYSRGRCLWGLDRIGSLAALRHSWPGALQRVAERL